MEDLGILQRMEPGDDRADPAVVDEGCNCRQFVYGDVAGAEYLPLVSVDQPRGRFSSPSLYEIPR